MIRMYGTPWCGDCKRAKKFFGEHRVPYEWVDVDADAEGLRIAVEANHGRRRIPVVFFEDGSVLIEPSNAELAAKLGMQTTPDLAYYDVAIVGGGPAGLTAALYCAREGLDVLVVERAGLGGQAGVTERLDNYPGFPTGIGGAAFADRLVEQCRRFGVELLAAAEVTGLAVDGRYRTVRLAGGTEVCAAAVLLAPGSRYRRLGVPGEADFIGAGVHFCATCDGPFYRGRELLVVGGGNSAVEESLFLTRFGTSVTILTRDDRLTASAMAVEKALAEAKITVRYGVEVVRFTGEGSLAAVTVRDRSTGATEELHPAAVFVFIGLSPNTRFLRGQVELTGAGFIVADGTLVTSMPGVYAAGDARYGSTKQLVSAAGEGATAALMIRQYLESQGIAPRVGELVPESS